MRYAIVIEKAAGNFSAYVPDLPGCVATGNDVAAVEANVREAIRFHIEGLKEDGIEVPAPTSITGYVEMADDLTKIGKGDRIRVALQKHEVQYLARKHQITGPAAAGAIRAAGPMRAKVEAYIREKKSDGTYKKR